MIEILFLKTSYFKWLKYRNCSRINASNNCARTLMPSRWYQSSLVVTNELRLAPALQRLSALQLHHHLLQLHCYYYYYYNSTTDVTISNKYRQMHSFITESLRLKKW